jgi:acylphosphatase
MSELLELTAVFKGDVQGVGFRAKAKHFADQLKVTGFARNLADGNVEICAQGEKGQLQRLLDKLQGEFRLSIQTVDHNFHAVKAIHSDFKII